MAKIEMSTRLNAPVDEVFSYVAEFRTLREYNPSVVSVEALSDTLPAVGARYRITMSMFGHEIRPVLTVTQMKLNELIETRLDAFIPATEKRLFAASGSQTDLFFSIEFSCRFPLLGVILDVLLVWLFAGRQARTEMTLLTEHFGSGNAGPDLTEKTG